MINKKIIIIFIVTLFTFVVGYVYWQSLFGILKINSEYTSFKITVDNKEYNIEKIPTSIKIKSGEYQITAKKEEYEIIANKINIKKGETLVVNIEFYPLSGEVEEDANATHTFYKKHLVKILALPKNEDFGEIRYDGKKNKFIIKLNENSESNITALDQWFRINTEEIYGLEDFSYSLIK